MVGFKNRLALHHHKSAALCAGGEVKSTRACAPAGAKHGRKNSNREAAAKIAARLEGGSENENIGGNSKAARAAYRGEIAPEKKKSL